MDQSESHTTKRSNHIALDQFFMNTFQNTIQGKIGIPLDASNESLNNIPHIEAHSR